MKTGRFLSAAAALLLAAAFGFAQGIPSASLTGKVTTEGGVALPGVAVTVTSPSMQGTRDVTTSGNGDYIFNLLPSGEYTVRFALSGMSAVDRTVTLAAGAVGRVDVEMNPAAVAEAVTVSGRAGEAAGVESPQVSANYTKEFVEKLPVGRTLAATTLLAPGVTNNGPGGNDRLASIAISGAPSFDNLFLINGVVVNENLRGQPHDLFIEDAIQETTILTGAISAEYGRFTGGVVSAITKSGGNRVLRVLPHELHERQVVGERPAEREPRRGLAHRQDEPGLRSHPRRADLDRSHLGLRGLSDAGDVPVPPDEPDGRARHDRPDCHRVRERPRPAASRGQAHGGVELAAQPRRHLHRHR